MSDDDESNRPSKKTKCTFGNHSIHADSNGMFQLRPWGQDEGKLYTFTLQNSGGGLGKGAQCNESTGSSCCNKYFNEQPIQTFVYRMRAHLQHMHAPKTKTATPEANTNNRG